MKENLLVQFSVVSFVIMFTLAAGIASLLSTQLGHQIDDMQAHNALMMAGTLNTTNGDSMMMASDEDHAHNDSNMASTLNATNGDSMIMASDCILLFEKATIAASAMSIPLAAACAMPLAIAMHRPCCLPSCWLPPRPGAGS